MNLIKYNNIYYIYAIILANIALKSEAFINDLQDIIKLTSNIETFLFGSNFLKEISKSNINLPIVKDKQRKVIARINLLERELEKNVRKVSL